MRKTTLALAVLTSVILMMTYWSWKQLKLTSVEPTSLRLTLDNTIESLDPAKAYSDDSLFLSAQAMEPLYQYHYLKRPYEIEPLVAEGPPQFSNEGKTILIKLKKGIQFHRHPAFGTTVRELTSNDFVVQFKRLALESLNSPGRSLFSGLIEGFDDFSASIHDDWKKVNQAVLSGVTAVDPHTLRINLTRVEPNIIYYLALNFLSPVPWELMEFYKNDLSSVLIGTGPYEFEKHSRDYYEMKKFKTYREDFYPSSGDRYANVQKLLNSSQESIPFIDNIKFYVTTSEDERWAKFFRREIDMLNVPKTFLTKLYNEKGELSSELKKNNVELKHFPILANRWLAFNMRHPVLGQNEFLRRAIAYSIDYEKYIQLLSRNTNLRANSVLVPGIAGYMPAKDFRFRFDQSQAREYLKLSGFKDVKDIPTIVYSTRGNQGINLAEAEFVKEHLEAVGLKVEVQVLTFSEFLKKGRAGELMFFTDNWLFDFPDAENILQLLVSSNFPGINKSGYSNPRIDELYSKLKLTGGLDERDTIVHEMEGIVFDDVPWIPMMYESSFVLQYPEVKNFRKSSIIRNYIKYLKIER
ncbi:MAG TPA: ABC transporter substrate-binding protein [Bacteriovoracaceae bacterium]|nr:ABC transporter substrate-binding protein [Bacteriovoracaceae bacterium]